VMLVYQPQRPSPKQTVCIDIFIIFQSTTTRFEWRCVFAIVCNNGCVGGGTFVVIIQYIHFISFSYSKHIMHFNVSCLYYFLRKCSVISLLGV
jgi:hypothetical protein